MPDGCIQTASISATPFPVFHKSATIRNDNRPIPNKRDSSFLILNSLFRKNNLFDEKKNFIFAEMMNFIFAEFSGNGMYFSRSFCGNGKFIFGGIPKLIFRVKCADSRRHSRESGNPFLPTNPRIHLVFAKKMRGNSKLSRKIREIPKLIAPNKFPLSRE